jgi:hypothetical protein
VRRGILALAFAYLLAGSTGLAQAPVPTFGLEALPKTAAELSKRFTPSQLDVIEMLNRRDREHLLRSDPPVPGLVVPVTWSDDPLAYSPFPVVWAAAEPHEKAIVVHQPMQAFAAYEQGRLVRWGPVSTGRKETATPEGAFNLTWRARSRRSTDNQDWLLEWYFNFVNARGISFHLFDLPGYPASHACVRLLLRDAQWLYGWGRQWTLDETRRNVVTPGTPVLILGAYGFGKPPPWLSIEALASAIALPDTLGATGPLAPGVPFSVPPAGSDRSVSPDSRHPPVLTAPLVRSRTYTDRQAPTVPAPRQPR